MATDLVTQAKEVGIDLALFDALKPMGMSVYESAIKAAIKEAKKAGGIDHVQVFVEQSQEELSTLSEGLRATLAALEAYNKRNGTQLRLDAEELMKDNGAANAITDGSKKGKRGIKRAFTPVNVNYAELYTALRAKGEGTKAGIAIKIYAHTVEGKRDEGISGMLLEGGKAKVNGKTYDSLPAAVSAVLTEAHSKGTRSLKGGNHTKLVRMSVNGEHMTAEKAWKTLTTGSIDSASEEDDGTEE